MGQFPIYDAGHLPYPRVLLTPSGQPSGLLMCISNGRGGGPMIEDCDKTSEFTIGDLADEFGVTPRTLRFYEDRGLLKPRRAGSTRLYSDADRELFAVILAGKKLGFTLTEIRRLLAGERDLRLSEATCCEQIEMLERQKQTIEEALAELHRIRAALAVAGADVLPFRPANQAFIPARPAAEGPPLHPR